MGSRRGRLRIRILGEKYLKSTDLNPQPQRGRTPGAPRWIMSTARFARKSMTCWDAGLTRGFRKFSLWWRVSSARRARWLIGRVKAVGRRTTMTRRTRRRTRRRPSHRRILSSSRHLIAAHHEQCLTVSSSHRLFVSSSHRPILEHHQQFLIAPSSHRLIVTLPHRLSFASSHHRRTP